MSNKERVVQLLNQVPDYKMEYVIAYIQGIIDGGNDSLPDDTLEALQQAENGDLEVYGSTQALFASWEN